MAKHETPQWKLTYIRENHVDKTVTEMEKHLKISNSKIRSYLKELGLKAKPSEFRLLHRKPGTIIKGHPYVHPYKKFETPKKQRPPAVYSNPNYLEQYQ